MTKGIFFGAGQFGFITNDGNPDVQMLFTEPLEFAIEGESNEVVAKAQRGGITTITGAALNEQNYKAKVKIEAVSWRTLQIAFGMSAATSVDFKDPTTKQARISAAGEITDTDILALAGPPAFLAPVYAASPSEDFSYAEASPTTVNTALTPKQFKVDRTANKIIFNPSEAGKIVAYQTTKIIPLAETIGQEAVFRKLDNISFSAIGYGNGGSDHSKIIVPEMSRISVPTLSMSGSQTSLELEYRLIQTEKSVGLPFIMVKKH
jgi:hypothetical protein